MTRVSPRSRLLLPRINAFTLVELLAVIAIVGILAAIIIPVIGKVRDNARNSGCVANLRQVGNAFRLYAADNRGLYPAPRQADDANPSANQNPLLGPWQIELAAYLAPKLQVNNVYRLKEVGETNSAFFCPAYVRFYPSQTALRDNGLSTLGYGMNFELNVNGHPLNYQGGSPVTRFPAIAIAEPARQILVGDSGDYHIFLTGGDWAPSSNASYPDGYSSGAPKRHGSHANYLFADGHVAPLSPEDARVALRLRL